MVSGKRPCRIARWLGLIAIVPMFVPGIALGQEPIPQGDAFRVNTGTLGWQNMSSVSLDGAGNFVVVWQSFLSSGSSGVYGRRFDRGGNPLGEGEQLNAESGRSLGSQASVAKTADGGFVAVWRSSSRQTSSDNGIFVRRFDSEGRPREGDIRVSQLDDPSSPEILSVGYLPRIAATPDGGFIVVWDESAFEPGRGAQVSIKARPYDNDHGFLPEFQVDEGPASSGFVGNWYPAIVALADGFVISWQKYSASTGQSTVYARQYDANATPLTPEVLVSAPVNGTTPVFPAVAALREGSIVVWRDFARRKILGQRLDTAGILLGEELDIGPSKELVLPSVSADGDGDFVVVWADLLDLEPQDEWHVLGRRYTKGGVAGESFQVSLPGEPGYPVASVASAENGDFVVTWTGGTEEDPDIFARRFRVEDGSSVAVLPDPIPVDSLWGRGFPGLTGFFILASDGFDATRVDPKAIRFGPNRAHPFWSLLSDVNDDGSADLGVIFFTTLTGIPCGESETPLSGAMVGGSSFERSVPIRFPCSQ